MITPGRVSAAAPRPSAALTCEKAPFAGTVRSMRCVACVRRLLLAPDLSEPTAQQGGDFLLNLRIVQQTQECLFESLVLLGLLDLVFSFGSIFHRPIMPWVSSADRPRAVLAARRPHNYGAVGKTFLATPIIAELSIFHWV